MQYLSFLCINLFNLGRVFMRTILVSLPTLEAKNFTWNVDRFNSNFSYILDQIKEFIKAKQVNFASYTLKTICPFYYIR